MLGLLAPVGTPQLNGGSLSALFPLVRSLSLPGAGGQVGQLFPVIQPSLSPAPGAGGPQSNLFPAIHPSSSPAARHTRPRAYVAAVTKTTDLPLDGGQVAALACLALAALLTVASARSRTRRRG